MYVVDVLQHEYLCYHEKIYIQMCHADFTLKAVLLMSLGVQKCALLSCLAMQILAMKITLTFENNKGKSMTMVDMIIVNFLLRYHFKQYSFW